MKKIAAVTTAVAVSLAGVAVPQAGASQITVSPDGSCTIATTQADIDYTLKAGKDYWLEVARAYDTYTPGTYDDLASLWKGKVPSKNTALVYQVTTSVYKKTAAQHSYGNEIVGKLMDSYVEFADIAINQNNVPIGTQTTFTRAKIQELYGQGYSPRPDLPSTIWGDPAADGMVIKIANGVLDYREKLEKLGMINAKQCLSGRSGNTDFAAGAAGAGLSEEAAIGLSVTAGVLGLAAIIAALITYVPAVRALMPPQILALLPAA